MKNQVLLRISVTLNYLSLLAIMGGYHLLRHRIHTGWSLVLIALSLSYLIVSFWMLYGRTKLWGLVHRVNGDLPDRLRSQMTRAVNRAYQVFSILVLSSLILAILIRHAPVMVGPVEVVSFLYFAHTLPAAILKWD